MFGDIDAGLSLASKIGCSSEIERRSHGSETNIHLSVDGKLSLDWIGARLANNICVFVRLGCRDNRSSLVV